MQDIKLTAWQHLEKLAVQIGMRWIGMPSIDQAGKYVESVFKDRGWKTSRQAYDCVRWQMTSASLACDGIPLELQVNTYAPSCNVKAEMIFCCTLAELKLANITGKVAVLSGALTRQDWVPRYACYIAGPDPVVELLEKAQPAAVIMVSPKLDVFRPIYEDWEFKIPSVSVSARVGRRLLENCTKSVQLKVESTRQPASTFSVIARRAGTRRERILVSAHYDTDWTSPGAFDDASGTALLLAMAKHLPRTECGIELVAFSGEDGSAIEPTVYFDQTSSEDVASLLAVINIDGVGIKLGSNTLTLMSGSKALAEELKQMLPDFPSVSWGDPWYESDHTAFAMRGIPSIPVSSAGWPGVHHTPEDTLEWMDADKLHEAYRLVENVILLLDARDQAWCKEA